jgi:hypothetical protein
MPENGVAASKRVRPRLAGPCPGRQEALTTTTPIQGAHVAHLPDNGVQELSGEP